MSYNAKPKNTQDNEKHIIIINHRLCVHSFELLI